jgi:hypothetical protein
MKSGQSVARESIKMAVVIENIGATDLSGRLVESLNLIPFEIPPSTINRPPGEVMIEITRCVISTMILPTVNDNLAVAVGLKSLLLS